MAGYRYGSLAPDETTTYNSSSSGGSGYDYTKLIGKYLGGGAGGNGGMARPSGGGGYGFGGGGGIAGFGQSIIGNAMRGMPAHGYGGVGNMTINPATQAYLQREQMPYMTELEKVRLANEGSLATARMQVGGSLAQAQMQAQMQRDIEMQRIADNEKNRQHLAEMARRGQVGDAYQTRLQNYYQYGLGE